MKKIGLAAIAVLALVLTSVGLAPSASAYPEVTCDVTVNAQVLHSGERLVVTATAGGTVQAQRAAATSDVTWTITWNGITRHGKGSRFVTKFIAPNVSSSKVLTLESSMTSASGNCVRSLDITVLPQDIVSPPNGGGHLPNTGGPRLLWLLAGLALVILGGGAAFSARRRSS